MKLEELKVALIQTFFKNSDFGIEQSKVEEVFDDMSKTLNADMSSLSEEISELHTGVSSEPSKAFRKFTEGRKARLTINEDDGSTVMALFAAVRAGTEVMYRDLTSGLHENKRGDLATVKQALRQAKNKNDEIYFSIQNDEVK